MAQTTISLEDSTVSPPDRRRVLRPNSYQDALDLVAEEFPHIPKNDAIFQFNDEANKLTSISSRVWGVVVPTLTELYVNVRAPRRPRESSPRLAETSTATRPTTRIVTVSQRSNPSGIKREHDQDPEVINLVSDDEDDKRSPDIPVKRAVSEIDGDFLRELSESIISDDEEIDDLTRHSNSESEHMTALHTDHPEAFHPQEGLPTSNQSSSYSSSHHESVGARVYTGLNGTFWTSGVQEPNNNSEALNEDPNQPDASSSSNKRKRSRPKRNCVTRDYKLLDDSESGSGSVKQSPTKKRRILQLIGSSVAEDSITVKTKDGGTRILSLASIRIPDTGNDENAILERNTVWAKMPSYPWWPARIFAKDYGKNSEPIPDTIKTLYQEHVADNPEKERHIIKFFGEDRESWQFLNKDCMRFLGVDADLDQLMLIADSPFNRYCKMWEDKHWRKRCLNAYREAIGCSRVKE